MKSFFSEYVYLTVPILSWFIAQFFKFVFVMIRYRKPDFKRLVGSGGMPSGHSAFIVSFAFFVVFDILASQESYRRFFCTL
jgi:acid phosphatase family membrane protein YuiD